ncbi:transglycosylase domain-containing protein [Microbacterium gorillae]|uniref:transglycosylase domain-containing protein n=1 Tax=Microbacterium gorillae TaxID=1231063 RepID=UPI00058FE916|nr:transglycosylase domain-containing protein [Microbacterium gorillae]
MPGTKRTASGVLGGLLGLLGLSVVAGILITATVTPAIAVSGLAAKSGIDMFDSLPNSLKIDKIMEPTIFYAKDASGKDVEMARFYQQNRKPVAYNQIAPVMIDAITSSEDNRFFTHGGVDMQGTVRALLSNLQHKDTSGGSSISQQYVKNVLIQRCEYTAVDDTARDDCYEAATNAKGTDGLKRKLQEMRYAISLETQYSKEDILLGYLNIASWGGITYGIEAAAQRYFSTSAANLTLNQAATLAGMVQSSNAFRIDHPDSEDNGAANGYAKTKDRRDTVLFRMRADGKITNAEYQAAIKEPIDPKISDPVVGCQQAVGKEYFCQLVKGMLLDDKTFGATLEDRIDKMNKDGLRVYTTLDPGLQEQSTAAMHDLVPASIPGMDLGSAGVQLDAATGRILSITQNTNFSDSGAPAGADPNAWSSMVYAGDQLHLATNGGAGFMTGSTFKVFTLLEWLIEGHSVNETLNAVHRNKDYTSECDGLIYSGNSENFDRNPGYRGNVMRFTRDSLNTGFLSMSEKINVCKVRDLAISLGAVPGDGKQLETSGLFWLLGSNNISPVAMASVYATLANKGSQCTPYAIDKVTDSTGTVIKEYKPTCTQKIDPNVAATALYALQGVMASGGTGQDGNPFDGTELAGKTGTAESIQTWLIQTSSRITSAAWVGNVEGLADVYDYDANGRQVNSIRYELGRRMQAAADALYPAGPFPQPDQNLTRLVYKDLPSVVGKSIDEATKIINDAGFEVNVGSEVDSDQPKGTIATQDPGAGSVQAGTTVTINPSSGKGATVPDVSGQSLFDARDALNAAGFSSVTQQCSEKKDAPKEGRVTGTNPGAGTSTSKGTSISIKVQAKKCPVG